MVNYTDDMNTVNDMMGMHNMMNKPEMSAKRQLFRDIQIVSFLIKDAQLFLDTHPQDENALSFFDYYSQLLCTLTEEYERQFGPLTVTGINVNDGWSWIEQPWPWEKEAW